ncbi:MAG: FAD-binding protein, partial [Thermoguttaceae bacterium]
MTVPRYLAPFHPKAVPHFFTDVLIIGSGLAGLRAALAVDSSLCVLVISKNALNQSSSSYAQGGVASVFDPNDSFDNHVQDTLTVGGTLCDPRVVKHVVDEAPLRIALERRIHVSRDRRYVAADWPDEVRRPVVDVQHHPQDPLIP